MKKRSKRKDEFVRHTYLIKIQKTRSFLKNLELSVLNPGIVLNISMEFFHTV